MDSVEGAKSLIRAGFDIAAKPNDFYGPAYIAIGPAIKVGTTTYSFPQIVRLSFFSFLPLSFSSLFLTNFFLSHFLFK